MKKTTEATAPKGKAPKNRTAKVQFILKNPTKGALRFTEVDDKDQPLASADDGAIGTLYVRKAFLDKLGIDSCDSLDLTINFHE